MNTGITCKKAVELISKKEEGKLSAWQRFQLWKHLAVCELCRRFLRQNKLFRHLSDETVHQLSASDKKKITDTVFKDTQNPNT